MAVYSVGSANHDNCMAACSVSRANHNKCMASYRVALVSHALCGCILRVRLSALIKKSLPDDALLIQPASAYRN
jgi:hypothetical protein